MRRLLIGAIAASAITATSVSLAGDSARSMRGRDLFVKTWTFFDPEAAPGGDGLGPLYNDVSCVACHRQGGTGGGGPIEKNAILGQAFFGAQFLVVHKNAVLDLPPPEVPSRTVQRNTPALFGAGQINRISDATLRAQEELERADPQTAGRVGRTPTGAIARFGWKGQTGTLTDFVANACAVEVGLEVADHPDVTPSDGLTADVFRAARDYAKRAAGDGALVGDGVDLTSEDLGALVEFVGSLPPPPPAEAAVREPGERIFTDVGCAACHAINLGSVRGLYSDLLLHDLGDELADPARSYYTDDDVPVGAAEATATEWRTPPLWGVGASPPYLHDGRADTLDGAIRLHGGQAGPARDAYAGLAAEDQATLLAFLAALSTP